MQKEQLTSLEQEQRELEGKMEQIKRSMDAAKSDQRNSQTHLSRLQQDEFRVKQVDNMLLVYVNGFVVIHDRVACKSRAFTFPSQ